MNNSLGVGDSAGSGKVLLCDHCKSSNPIGSVKCKECGYYIVSKEPVDAAVASEIRKADYRQKAEKDKIRYEADLKKYKTGTMILAPIIAVWFLAMLIVWIVSVETAPKDETKTVPIEYKPYSQSLEIGENAKIEVVSGYSMAMLNVSETKNGIEYPNVNYYYLHVYCADGQEGIIKIHEWKAKGLFKPHPLIFTCDEPVTLYGTIVDTPDDAIAKYEDRHERYSDPKELGKALKEYKNMEILLNNKFEETVVTEHEETSAEKVFKIFCYVSPLFIFLFLILINRKKPRRKYPDLQVNNIPFNQG